MKKAVVIATAVIGMMSSCVQDNTKYVIAHRVDGDTITLHKIRVDRSFNVGEIMFPINGTTKFKIIRECRK